MAINIQRIIIFHVLILISNFASGQSPLEGFKPFDPVNVASKVAVDLDSYYFVAENTLYTFRPGFYYSIPNKRHLMGLSVPIVHSIFSGDFAGYENTTGIGDIRFAYLGVPYQSKDALGLQRITAMMEITAPTGNEQLGRGVGEWVYKPGVAISIRANEAVHIFPKVTFQFSTSELNSLGGGDGLPDLEDPEEHESLKVISFGLPATLAVESWQGWVTLSPEYIHTFTEDTYFIFLQMELGKMIGKRTSTSLQITRFIAGQPRLETIFRVRFNFFLNH